jgi:biotin carboxyl carrier protein
VKADAIVDGHAAKLEVDDGRFRYERDGKAIEREYSIAPLTPGSYSVLIGGKVYHAVSVNGAIRVNRREFSIEVFDPREMRARGTGGVGEGRQNILAPMPGKVVRLLVAVGDTVEAGQGLVVVEAMKMQNEMKSPKDGRVAEVKTRPEATVAAGEVLMVIE